MEKKKKLSKKKNSRKSSGANLTVQRITNNVHFEILGKTNVREDVIEWGQSRYVIRLLIEPLIIPPSKQLKKLLSDTSIEYFVEIFKMEKKKRTCEKSELSYVTRKTCRLEDKRQAETTLSKGKYRKENCKK